MHSGPSALNIGRIPPILTERIIMCEEDADKHKHDALGAAFCAVKIYRDVGAFMDTVSDRFLARKEIDRHVMQ